MARAFSTLHLPLTSIMPRCLSPKPVERLP
jgi:hypothetical protein